MASATKRTKPLSGEIYLSRGLHQGRPIWHYLVVDKMKLPILLTEAKKGTVDLATFGHIIFSGFGEAPPQEVIDFVKKKYGGTIH